MYSTCIANVIMNAATSCPSSSRNNTNTNNNDPSECFREWMNLQEQDLSDLLRVQSLHSEESRRGDEQGESDADGATPDDEELNDVISNIIQHFRDYIQERSRLARQNVSPYFAPRWCTQLECSVLWIAGCRPTIFIRLLYALIGDEIESGVEEFLQGTRTTIGNLGDVSPTQMNLINTLHCKTIREEDKLSAKLASLQEDMADNPISAIARRLRLGGYIQPLEREVVENALGQLARSMMNVMKEADVLRLSTLKELLSILTPIQGVNFLVASKTLHLCIHDWSSGGAVTAPGPANHHDQTQPPPEEYP